MFQIPGILRALIPVITVWFWRKEVVPRDQRCHGGDSRALVHLLRKFYFPFVCILASESLQGDYVIELKMELSIIPRFPCSKHILALINPPETRELYADTFNNQS